MSREHEGNDDSDAGAVDPVQIGKVEDPELCDLVEHGWYYDDPDNPTEIFVCPQTCDLFHEAVDSAEVNIIFGCETIPAEIGKPYLTRDGLLTVASLLNPSEVTVLRYVVDDDS